MKNFSKVVLFAIGLIVATTQVNAQNKLGYVSTQDLIGIMPETAKADSNLQQYRNALVQNAQDKETALSAAIDKFNKDSATYTEAVKTVKRTELQKQLQELQTEEQRIQQALQQRQEELIAPINKKAFDAIQQIAKENGYSYIFEKNALLVAPPGDDVLQLVAKKLNIKLPATATQTVPPKITPKQ